MRVIMLLLGFSLLFFSFTSCSDHKVPEREKAIVETGETTDKVTGINLVFRPEVDILFVIDDSGSMSSHQSNLAHNAEEFTRQIKASVLIDYHIGVITSDMDSGSRSGKLYASRGAPKYIEKNTPDGMIHLARNMQPGTNGSYDETFFEPVVAALSSPLVTGENLGFYRDNAFLAIIFITDAINHGPMNADSFYDFLLQLKSYNADKIMAYGAIIPPGDKDCSRDEWSSEPVEIFRFLEEKVKKVSGNNWFNLCSPNFGSELARIGADLEKRIEFFVPFKEFPVLDSIVVKYGNQIIPRDFDKGWSYDVKRVGILLGRNVEIEEDPNAELSISYIPAKVRP